MTNRAGRLLQAVDRTAGGLAADLSLYGLSAAFALVTALTSTLLPHRAWGTVAAWGYLGATFVVFVQLVTRRFLRQRALLTWLTWGFVALLPLVIQSVQRAGGRSDRAQDEVLVVEEMGHRLVFDGSPYLGREALAALPSPLSGYAPYQPGMAVFGIPRALAGDYWWTDARIYFALVTALALAFAVRLLPGGVTAQPTGVYEARPPASTSLSPTSLSPTSPHLAGLSTASARLAGLSTASARLAGWQHSAALVRGVQFVTVLPICALTLATGGDDLPVLALSLLALTLCAADRFGLAGVAVGAAAACKLFAFPVVAVLIVLAIATGNWRRFLPGAVGLPALALVPPYLVDAGAFVENVIRFPLGHGLVTSPAQSPFPGYLISTLLPGGRYLAMGLLVAVAAAIAVLFFRRPPRTAMSAALFCGFGLLAAILLMPTTRFGYLLYPLALLAWAPTLRKPTGSTQLLSDTALYRQ